MGRILFLQRKYRAAVKQFQHTLSIDPEDLAAHYNMMLCYRGLQENAKSDHEMKLYLRFKANEIARAITGPFKRNHPNENKLAQPIHEQVSINEEDPHGLEFYWNYGQRWAWMPGKMGQAQETALAKYKRNGSYGYLAAMRKEKLKLHPAHRVLAQKKLPMQANHKVAVDKKLRPRVMHKIVAEERALR
jgi:hypothetical protein